MTVATDSQKQPWVAWLAEEYPSDGGSSSNWLVHVRSPNGDTQELDLTNESLAGTDTLRLLPGGLDGTAEFPILHSREQNPEARREFYIVASRFQRLLVNST